MWQTKAFLAWVAPPPGAWRCALSAGGTLGAVWRVRHALTLLSDRQWSFSSCHRVARNHVWSVVVMSRGSERDRGPWLGRLGYEEEHLYKKLPRIPSGSAP